MFRSLINLTFGLLVIIVTGSRFVSGDVLIAENRFLERRFESNGGGLSGGMLVNKITGHSFAFEWGDFRVKFLDGSTLTGSDFNLERTMLSNKTGTTYIFALTNELHHIEARVEAVIHPKEPWVRKRVLLRQHGSEILTLDEVDVENVRVDARKTIATKSTRGQPLVFDNEWFAGIEFPAGENIYTNGILSLRQHPGVALTSNWWASDWAVMGVAATGKVRSAFADYLAAVALPARSFTLYNSWYDLRRSELNTKSLQETFDKCQVKLDSFVVDDGWQNPDSLWETDQKLLPEGWSSLANYLKEHGSRLGLWMPLDGYGLDIGWGRANNFEVSTAGKYYCMSGSNYTAAIRSRVARLFHDCDINYFKHDFNFYRCREPNHGHLPDDKHSEEANVRAQMTLLAAMRRTNTNVFLNVTSGTWLSPWWLLRADAVWRGGNDTGTEKRPIAWQPRDWEVSYRDTVLYHNASQEAPLFPISRMMVHGIVNGKLARLGGSDEPLDKWADYVAGYVGLGVRMRELYITPSLLSDKEWSILKKAIEWANQHAATLDRGTWIGGNPAGSELYGIEHVGENETIWMLRNPAPVSQSISLTIPSGKHLAQIFPCRSDISGKDVTVRGHGTVIVQTVDSPQDRQEPEVKNPEPVFLDDSLLRLKFDAGADITRARFVAVVEGTTTSLTMKAKVNAAEVTSKKITGDGWAAYLVPLSAGPNTIEAVFDPGDGLFVSGEFNLSQYIEVEQEVARDDSPFGIEFVRLVVPIIKPGPLPLPRRERVIATTEELSKATAAKLHLRIFGSNKEAPHNDKPLSLNGVVLGNFPSNNGQLDTWQEVVIDLPRDARQSLSLDNKLELINRGGDAFKFGGVALAAEIPGKGWVQTPLNNTIYCSNSNWEHSEGRNIKNGRLTLHLAFPRKQASSR